MVTTRSRRPSSQDSTAAAAAAASNGQTKTGDATSTDDRNPKKRQFEEPPPPNKQARQKTEQSNGNANNTKQQQQQQQPRQGTTQSPTILERGTIYYFIRARVNIETPRQVSDIARGYLILRPIPASAGSSKDALVDKAKSQSATTRLLALPKKLLPGSSQDRFMAFVEKADASYENLRDELLKGDEYETKTAGHRHRPDATPVGEGVYVISSTGRESHLSYMATVPKEMGELQRALRFNERGSFILSSKNPKAESPPNAQLPEGADYPPE
ncbi:hypothetical protein AAL_01813 [Moelleriella libera RCEF 2490]|uniref:BTB domain transcription factor n=1 Tax=Moelleriella libera RCEF 2490 TaxID=1081109 RepID=A0A166UGR5_9HYPO|nr:hypothetical protein AAL_01813 [Moelleriella libera RCEF 2490]